VCAQEAQVEASSASVDPWDHTSSQLQGYLPGRVHSGRRPAQACCQLQVGTEFILVLLAQHILPFSLQPYTCIVSNRYFYTVLEPFLTITFLYYTTNITKTTKNLSELNKKTPGIIRQNSARPKVQMVRVNQWCLTKPPCGATVTYP